MSKEIIPSPGGSNKFSRLISKIKAALGIVENGNTASHTIASGKFVTWKGDLYKAKSAIPSGTTLSSSNLQAVSEGGLNELSEQIGNMIQTVSITITGIGANKGKGGSADVPVVSGMTPYAICPVETNHNDMVITECRFTSNQTKATISIFNMYGSSQDAVGKVAIFYH